MTRADVLRGNNEDSVSTHFRFILSVSVGLSLLLTLLQDSELIATSDITTSLPRAETRFIVMSTQSQSQEWKVLVHLSFFAHIPYSCLTTFLPPTPQEHAQRKVAEEKLKEQAVKLEAVESELKAATARANDTGRKLEEARKQHAHQVRTGRNARLVFCWVLQARAHFKHVPPFFDASSNLDEC